MKRGSAFRNLVLGYVDSWIEGVSIILFILLLYISWQLMQNEFTSTWGIWLLCIGTLVLFLISWSFFCVIEIRDLLKSIEENTRGGIALTTTSGIPQPIVDSQPVPQLSDDEKYCPNCNKIIKKVAKKCRFCDTWLDENNEVN